MQAELIKLLESQGRIEGTIIRMEENLKEHMRRTANVEGRSEKAFDQIEKLQLQIAKAQGAIALLSLLSIVFGLALAYVRITS